MKPIYVREAYRLLQKRFYFNSNYYYYYYIIIIIVISIIFVETEDIDLDDNEEV